jgi:hypothetical protein
MWAVVLNGNAIYHAEQARGRRGTGKLWCRYVDASAVDMLFIMEWVGEVKLWTGSIIVHKSGQR